MKLSELLGALDGLDPEADVVVRLAEPEGVENWHIDDVIGGDAALTDERNVQVERGRVVLLGDLIDE